MDSKIKFRALYKPFNVMIEWRALTAMLNGQIIGITEKTLCREKPKEKVKVAYLTGNPFFCEDLLMLRYAGVLDKKLKEIYEGDIVRNKGNYIYQVRYSVDKNEHWKGFYLSSEALLFGCWEDNTKEVIGNIYENPELLEKK